MDGASAIISIVAFSATCFEACVKALVILSKARSYRRDVSGVSLMLELEMRKLHAWAVEVGLSQQPPVLLVNTQYASIVPKLLEHLRSLVSDLDKLKNTHGLHLQETTEQLLALNGDASAFERLGLKTNDACEDLLARIFKQRKEPWKMLKWVTFDEQKVRRLLDQVKAFIHELQQILDRTRQVKLEKAVDVLIRSAVLKSVNEQDLDMIGLDSGGMWAGDDVAAAARLKKQGLLLGIMDIQHGPSQPTSQHDNESRIAQSFNFSQCLMPRYSNSDLARMRLPASRLSLATYSSGQAKMFAHYDDEPVLLEFKNDSGLDHDTMKDRLCKVSFFLRDLDDSFHGLSCRGFVKVYGRYAYVFHLPKEVLGPRATCQLPSFRTLRYMLDEVPVPSLNLRLDFAIQITETLLQLHTSGWFHKELRSGNVLFIRDSWKDISDFLLAPMHVTGYVYARADDSQEATEPLESELDADLYRHPACLAQPRAPFRRAFDAFSVGCILLEIGLWCSLSRLFQRASGRPRDHQAQSVNLKRIRHEIFFSHTDRRNSSDYSKDMTAEKLEMRDDVLRDLQAMMGKSYSAIVLELMYSSRREGRVSPGSGQGVPIYRNSLHSEIECLQKLRTIAEVL